MCPYCHAGPGKECLITIKFDSQTLPPFHKERYTLAKELYMSSQTQRELLEIGLLTEQEAEAPMNDFESLLRAIVRITSTVADLAKEVREIRNKI
jgi:hypothetical protein